MLKLYDELAEWWPLLSPPEDYAEEADFYRQLFLKAGLPAAATLLELGCGGGSNAFYLKHSFAHVTLTDLSPAMLAISLGLNPECEHIQGDMRSLRLGRSFDAVFIHDAIDYMTTREDLRRAMETAYVHCKPGGATLLVPDHVTETFKLETVHGGVDAGGRGLRYLEWSFDPDESDTVCTTQYVYVMREGSGEMRMEHEAHIYGIFPRAEWLQLLVEVGFQAEAVQDPYERDIFVARRPKES